MAHKAAGKSLLAKFFGIRLLISSIPVDKEKEQILQIHPRVHLGCEILILSITLEFRAPQHAVSIPQVSPDSITSTERACDPYLKTLQSYPRLFDALLTMSLGIA